MNGSVLKVLGIVAGVIGVGASLLGDWIADKKLDSKIEERVIKAIADRKE